VAQVTIIRLDTLGASLGLALRKAEPSLSVIGLEPDPQLARRAQQVGAVERIERSAHGACRNAALIILNEPISRLHDALEAIAPALKPGCTVTTTAPLMAPALKWADELLPEGVSFVAGHPVLDPTRPDDTPDAALFQQAQYCIVASTKASPAAMDLVTQLALTVGAQPFFLDAAEHDGLMTAVEGLAELLDMTLMNAAANASSWRDMQRVAGPAFARATACVESESSEETIAALRANRQNVARWLEMYRAKLGEVRAALLADDEAALTKLLTEARQARGQWLRDRRSGNVEHAAPMPKVTMGSILGSMVWPQRPSPEDRRSR